MEIIAVVFHKDLQFFSCPFPFFARFAQTPLAKKQRLLYNRGTEDIPLDRILQWVREIWKPNPSSFEKGVYLIMKTDLNLPAGYAVLSEEEMTYTEGGAAIVSGLIAVTSTIGFGVLGSSYVWGIQQGRAWLAQDQNRQGNLFTVIGRACDDLSADMRKSSSNALRDGVSTAMVVLLAPLSAILLLRR